MHMLHFIVLSLMLHNLEACPSLCLCSGSAAGFSVSCDCGAGQTWPGWSWIPANTTALSISSCSFRQMLPGALDNLSLLKNLTVYDSQITTLSKGLFSKTVLLQRIEFIHNLNLESIEKNIFIGLSHLRYLSFKDCASLPLRQLPNIFSGVHSKNEVDFNFNAINSFQKSSSLTLKKQDLEGLQNISTNVLAFERCSINFLEIEVFSQLHTTKCFSVAYNMLSLMSYSDVMKMLKELLTLPKLYFVHMSDQIDTLGKSDEEYRFVASQCSSSQADLQTLRCPRLSQDQVIDYGYAVFQLPKSIRHVIGNNLVGLKSKLGPFAVFDNNVTLISARDSAIFTLQGPVIGFTCLRELDISGTRLIVENIHVFSYFPSLQLLNLSRCDLQNQISDKNNSFIRNMPSLKVLDLTENDMEYIDLTELSLHAPNLSQLLLAGNLLKRIPEIISFSLLYLHLEDNYISSFTRSDREKLNRLHESSYVQVSMKGNTFSCFCDPQTYSFLRWLKHTDVRLVDVDEYTCFDGWSGFNSDQKLIRINVPTMWLRCNAVVIMLAVGIIPAITVVILLTRCVYRRRYIIAFNILAIRLYLSSCCRKREEQADEFQQLVDTDDLRHPHTDKLLGRDPVQFVYIIFANFPENQSLALSVGEEIEANTRYHCVYHDLSFILGKPETLNIYYLLSGSERCVVLLTNDFFEDKSALLALRYSLVQGTSGYHIIVGVDPVPLQQLLDDEMESIRGLLLSTNMIEYPENSHGRRLAKDQIIRAVNKKNEDTRTICSNLVCCV